MWSSELEFRVLGPLVVVRRGAEVALGGPRQRLVLALLLVSAGRAVPAERLLDEIWGGTAPASRTGPLRTYIWQLRRLLAADGRAGTGTGTADPDPGPLVSRDAGYQLDIDPDQLDSARFEAYFAAASASASEQPTRALTALDSALGLWRGPAFGGLATEPGIQSEATRLDQLRLGAQELRAELLLATGGHTQVCAELGTLARDNPERERLWAMLMTALYRCGRQSDALRCFQEARAQLVEHLGIEPGPELRELEQAILRQDPMLDWPPRSGPPTPQIPQTAQTESVPATRPSTSTATSAEQRVARATGEPHPSGQSPRSGGHNLPRQLTSFVGRGAERVTVADMLDRHRLVTLSGSGGCGKTRLALAVAEDVLLRFPDGVWFVDLAAVSDPALIARALAGPLGVETDQLGQLDHVCGRIADQMLLLILDNCEHLVDAVAEVIEQMLLRCPSLRILATSREEIRIRAELVWRVPALSLPVHDEVGGDQDRFLNSEAVELFIERGRSALPRFAPTADSLAAVAQICRRLDGIPLAIELAAALAGSLPVTDIAERLDDAFRLLSPGTRQGVPRHRTLRATLDWSFDLLDDDARQLFVRLGVFVGDFTLAAAERVAGTGPDPMAVAQGLGKLVVTSMVSVVAGAEGADRYRMLETIRQYALERLDELDEAEEIRWRHARYYADFAAEAERHVHGPTASEWLARLTSELPNLRKAVSWAIDHDDVETGLRLAAGYLPWFFARMALLDELSRWLAAGLQREEDLPPDLRLMALTAASTVAFMQGDFSHTRQLGEEGIAIARELDDPRQLALSLMVRGAAAVFEGDLARAEECFEQAQPLCQRLGDRWGTAWMLTGWAFGSRRAGHIELARRQLQESLEIFRELHDQHGQILPLVHLALAAQEEDQIDDALALATEAVGLADALGDRQQQHLSLCVLGRVEMSLGHLDRAQELLVRSIRHFPGAHHQLMVAIALEGLAGLSSRAGHHADAAALLGFTQRLRDRWQLALSGPRERERSAWLETARAAIGADRIELELERGQTLSLADAVDLAEAATVSLTGLLR
jgi:predicted ATPase/DNA-binding SARP family transcriptional activator